MIRAVLCALLSGCTVVEHVQVLPIINPMTEDVSCCVAYAEIPPSTHLTVQVSKSPDLKVKLGAKWRF